MKTVLIIDDEPLFRAYVAQVLRSEGWQVLEAENGDQGVEVALARRPEVVLCDLLMPQSNGFQVCRTLRSHRELGGIKIVVVSARDYPTDRLSAMEAGAMDYLVKPVKPTELKTLLARLAGATGDSKAEALTSKMFPDHLPTTFRFWGVRGSIPTPGPETVRYGGNTSCVEVRSAGELILLDAGTGIRPLGRSLLAEFKNRPLVLSLLITHTHWDHIQGFPFFVPAYNPENRLCVLGYEGALHGLEEALSGQMANPYFPIGLSQMPGHLSIHELKDLAFAVGSIRVQAAYMNHPGICVGYRLHLREGSLTYIPDNEHFVRLKSHPHNNPTLSPTSESLEFARKQELRQVEFIQNSDVLIMDAQYDESEYEAHVGWGHSCVDDSVMMGLKGQVKQLYLFHHDPSHGDDKIDQMVDHARRLVAEQGGTMRVEAAREGLEVSLSAVVKGAQA